MQTPTDSLYHTSAHSAEAFQELAADLLRHGQPQLALNYCQLLLQTQPTAPNYKLLGDVLQRLHQVAEAETAYQNALKLKPNWAELQANLGTLYAQQRQWLKALLCYQKALQLKPGLSEVQRNLEQVWINIGQSSKQTASLQAVSLDELYNAFMLAPEQVGVQNLLRLSQVLQEQGQVEQARHCQQQATDLKHKLNAHLGKPTPLPAIVKPSALLNDALGVDPTSHQAAIQAYNLGNTYAQQQQWSQAETAYRRAVGLAPGWAIAQWHLAQVLERLNQTGAAVEQYFAALTLQPDLAQPAELCKFGQLFQQHHQPERALSCYEWALQQDENCLEAHRQLAELLSHQHQTERAIVHYQQALRLEPDASLYHALGDAYLKLGQQQSAVAAYRQAIALNSNFSWSHNNLGDALTQLEQWEGAAKAYRQAIELNPEFYWSHYNLGEALAKLGQWEEAVAAYRMALANEPEGAKTLQRLQMALHQKAKQELDGVLDYYRQAIALEPDNLDLFHQAIDVQPQNPELYLGLARALARQNQLEQATVYYQVALNLQPDLAQTAPTLEQFVAQRQFQTRQLPQTIACLFEFQSVAKIIEQSGLFNERYYKTQCSALALQEMSPLQHYIETGARQGYSPSPLFDHAYYLAQNPDVANSGVNPLAHYLHCGAAEGRDPHPLFSTAFYLAQNLDIADSGITPLAHYVLYGMAEGRVALSVERVTSVIQEIGSQANARHLACLGNTQQMPPRRLKIKVGIYCSSLGNYFMAEIADFLAALFEQIGVTVLRLCETDRRPDDLDFDVIVAPHEFFYLGMGKAWQDAPWLADSIMFNVEQPHTSWFAKAFYFLQKARLVFDINVKSAAILEKLGLAAYFLPLGYLSDYEPFSLKSQMPELTALGGLPKSARTSIIDLDAPLDNRPIDLHFIGTISPRRELFLAENAAWLSRYHCFFHIPPLEGPLLKGQDQALDTAAVIGLSQRSKILLNLHRENLPYFEWHRIVFHGLWQKTLVVTEPCHDVPGLTPGEHFIECRLSEMGSMIDWLLNTPTGRAEAERIRRAGHQAVQEKLAAEPIMHNLLTLLIEKQMMGARQ